MMKIPSLLSFTRSIIPSNGIFYYLDKNDKKQPIVIQKQTVRGSIANYANVYKEGKQDKEENIEKELRPENANIQKIDTCYLDPDVKRFSVSFSVNFTSNSLEPNACDDADYFKAITLFIKGFIEKKGFPDLAERYLTNIETRDGCGEIAILMTRRLSLRLVVRKKLDMCFR